MQYWTVEEIKQHALADHEAETEIAPGVVLHRRRILKFGLVGAFALLGGQSPSRQSLGAGAGLTPIPLASNRNDELNKSAGPEPSVTVADLVSQLHPQARKLISAEDPNETAYLSAVQQLLARVKLDEPWEIHDTGQRWSMETNCWMPPIVLFRIRMEPGSSMNLHDHRHYNGVLLCTEGKVRCRNFEYVQSNGKEWNVAAGEVPPAGEDFLIRQTQDTVLRPRQLSTLTRDRDNLHTLVAGDEGCELVDFFTHFRPEARSYDLEWDEKQPVDEKEQLYFASWKTE